MKHLLLISFLFVSAVAVSAHPRTTVVVTHPQTDTTSVVRPRTNVVVSRPATVVKVEKPLTAGGATEKFVRGSGEEKPAAAPKAATPVPSAKTAVANSYEPSYKKSKDLTPKKTDQSGGASADGLGMKDPVAAQKEAEARSSAVQKALDEGSFNKIVPPEIMGKLKQRNHEAAKAARKK